MSELQCGYAADTESDCWSFTVAILMFLGCIHCAAHFHRKIAWSRILIFPLFLPTGGVRLLDSSRSPKWMTLEEVYTASTRQRNYLIDLPNGEGGHLDLLHGFPSPECESTSDCLHPSVCARLCLHDISYTSFSPMCIKKILIYWISGYWNAVCRIFINVMLPLILQVQSIA